MSRPVQTVADVVIRPAAWPQDSAAARSLLNGYLDFLQNNPAGPVRVCISGYQRELETLSSVWDGEGAALLLTWRGKEALGCAGVRLLVERPGAAEIKRLWISPAARGMGLGRQLVQAAIAWARSRSARELLLDTVPPAMPEAQHLYRSMGFQECERYNGNPVSGLAYLRLQLG